MRQVLAMSPINGLHTTAGLCCKHLQKKGMTEHSTLCLPGGGGIYSVSSIAGHFCSDYRDARGVKSVLRHSPLDCQGPAGTGDSSQHTSRFPGNPQKQLPRH